MDLKKTIKRFPTITWLQDFIYSGFVQNEDGVFNVRNKSDRLYVSPEYEKDLRSYFFKFKQGTFIDVGAHIGKWSVAMGNRGMDVISVEPDSDNFETLNHNMIINKIKNYHALNVALFNKKGKMPFNRDRFSSARNSLIDTWIKKSNSLESTIDVKVDTLDNITKNIKDVVLVKLDVEGVESYVLKGAAKLLQSQHPAIIFEAWDNEAGMETLNRCKSILEKFDYKVKQINHNYYIAEVD